MDTPAAPLASRADVEVEQPERWAARLLAELARTAPPESTAEGEEVSIGSGRGVVRAEAARLVLLARAPDLASLERVQDVLGGHLERDAADEGVTVRWAR